MQPIWMVVFLFVGLAFAQEDYEDYFNLFDEKAQVTSTTTTTQKSTTEKPTEKPTTTTEKQSTTTEIPSTTTTMRITTATKTTTLTPATTTTPSAIGKMDATELFNARLESLFIKILKSINYKMDQMPENFVKELSKISTTTTTTTTTTPTPPRPTPPPTPHPLPPTPPPTPPKIERFLTDNVFEEDFFNDEKIEISTEENTTYLWINKNLQVVIGVSLLVGGTCIIVPICIGICWFCTRNKEKKKDEDFEMDSKKKEEETGEIADRTDEETNETKEEEKKPDRPLPPTPPNEFR